VSIAMATEPIRRVRAAPARSFSIEDDDYKARVDQAAADAMAAEAAIENLKSRKAQQHAQVAEAQSTITATQADVERTRLEEIRQRDLVASTYGTRQRLEQATADEKRFEATLERARADLEAQRRQMAVLDTQELQLRADLKAKQAVLTLAKITLGYTRIEAPVDGMVGERGVREGQYVRPGVQVISVVPLDTVWESRTTRKPSLLMWRSASLPASLLIPSLAWW
jgi:membrane fusion protein, multidrug efflux system